MNWNLKHTLLSLFFTAVGLQLCAADSIRVKTQDSIVVINVDANEYLYVADAQNTLYKLSKNGSIITKVNVKVYGNIKKIDCSNPFEIYTYHDEQNIVVYYDNMLNIRGETRLNDLFFTGVSNVARSYDNQLWVYDYSANTLSKISKQGEVLLESNNISTLVDNDLSVVDIQQFNNEIYLVDERQGLLHFDMFGTFRSLHAIGPIVSASIGETTWMVTPAGWVRYHPLMRRLETVTLGAKTKMPWAQHGNTLYTANNRTILTFTVN